MKRRLRWRGHAWFSTRAPKTSHYIIIMRNPSTRGATSQNFVQSSKIIIKDLTQIWCCHYDWQLLERLMSVIKASVVVASAMNNYMYYTRMLLMTPGYISFYKCLTERRGSWYKDDWLFVECRVCGRLWLVTTWSGGHGKVASRLGLKHMSPIVHNICGLMRLKVSSNNVLVLIDPPHLFSCFVQV